MRVRFLPVAVVTVIATMLLPAAAHAVNCGAPDPNTGQSAKAVLTLDADSDPDAIYKRGSGTRTINLIFKADGCTFDGSQAEPEMTVVSKNDAEEDLPQSAVTLRSAAFDDSEMTLNLQVDSEKFDPGSYGGLVEVRAPYLATTRTPISVSRSHDAPWLPILIGALAGLVAVLWFVATKFATRNELLIAPYWLIVVVIGGVAIGAFTAWSSYQNQDVWTWDENGISTFLAGVTGATTGSMATLLTALWKSHAPAGVPPPRPAPPPPVPAQP
jgi:hypothetical protein